MSTIECYFERSHMKKNLKYMAKLTGTKWDKILMQVMCDGGV
jgi:hypothetical protein